ncbi:hypothetical protein Leryth_020825 [Lithospermum erythrorhizon]|nr:hypothetical protein Leryth_020825 [Lithospermum erythrorhizon]
MGDAFDGILPVSVEAMLEKICREKGLQQPDFHVRKALGLVGENAALKILKDISKSQSIRTLNGYIMFLIKMLKESSPMSSAESVTIRSVPSSSVNSSPSNGETPCSSQVCRGQTLSPSTNVRQRSPLFGDQSSSLSNHQSDDRVGVNSRTSYSNSRGVMQRSPFSGDQSSPLSNHQSDDIVGVNSGTSYSKSRGVMQRSPLFGDQSSPLSNHQSDDIIGVTSRMSYSETKGAIQRSPLFCDQSTPLSNQRREDKVGGISRTRYSDSRENERSEGANRKLVDLSQLEFRRFFMLLTYTGNEKLEDVLTTDDVDDILGYKDSPMGAFESHIWNVYGQRFSDNTSRVQYADWNLRKTHLYYCYLNPDGSRLFKGPYLNAAGTHLQREVGDDNVLIVKFLQEGTYCSKSIADEGIFIGLRQYHFFVYKDAARGTKLKSKDKNESFVSCYFVHMESLGLGHKGQTYTLSGKTVHDARCRFMHVHMVSTMAKYMPRFSLILSKTVTLPVNLASVDIQIIEDIPCIDKNGRAVCDEEKEPLLLTDGTGFISKDLAAKCPKDFYKSKYLKDNSYEKHLNCLNDSLSSIDLGGKETEDLEYPLLMQCRLFYHGRAVKGTLLVDLMLPSSTIQIRPSMIKVKRDSRLSSLETFTSLEMVAISHKPKKAHLSKNLIVLLSYGNVPREYFLGLLRNALDSLKNIYTDEYTALKVADIYSERDDVSMARSMILADIPLHEPYLQHCLSAMAKEEKNGLKEGKLPIDDSYYLMGTVDPTGTLNPDEVSVILGDGQISGKVLVYRNPGLHHGDIHVLTAVYVSALEEMVGNAKYAIFFSAKGQRSVASEIANGDYDGDMYFVSRNPQLLEDFRPSKPWRRLTATLKTPQRKPHEVPIKELEHVLFQEFLEARCPSYAMATAADSWLAFMDKLLSLRDDNSEEKRRLNQKILKLIDLYYDAVDAPKSGNKVVIPDELKAKEYPHYMGKLKFSYQSDSVLGEVYDSAVRFIQNGQQPKIEIQKLPCFDVVLHEDYLNLWRTRYNKYRFDMKKALSSTDREVNNASAAVVIRKYKEMLYDADEFHNSIKNLKEIYDEALAIYHVTYDHAKSQGDVTKCGFAWKVAGPVLCSLYIRKQGENPLACSPAALRKIL